MTQQTRRNPIQFVLILLVAGLAMLSVAQPAGAQTFYLKRLAWPTWYHFSYLDPSHPQDPPAQLGKTRWGIKPHIRTETIGGKTISFVRLELHRYNPDDPTHQTFQGTEIVLNKDFGLPNQTNQNTTRDFEAYIRTPVIKGRPTIRSQGGIVPGFFPFSNAGGKNEIDFELLHKLMPQSKLWVNVYQNGVDFDDYPDGIPPGTVPYADHIHPVVNWNPSAWTRYKIKWATNTVQWIVNDNPASNGYLFQVQRTDHPVPDPQSKLQVHLNIWAPGDAWGAAADPTYVPGWPDESHYLDVQWVRISNGNLKLKGRK